MDHGSGGKGPSPDAGNVLSEPPAPRELSHAKGSIPALHDDREPREREDGARVFAAEGGVDPAGNESRLICGTGVEDRDSLSSERIGAKAVKEPLDGARGVAPMVGRPDQEKVKPLESGRRQPVDVRDDRRPDHAGGRNAPGDLLGGPTGVPIVRVAGDERSRHGAPAGPPPDHSAIDLSHKHGVRTS